MTHIVDTVTNHTRLRRNRKADWSRRLVRENTVTPDDLIWTFFLIEGENATEPVGSMPGVVRYTVDRAIEAVKEAYDLGIPAVAPFANPPIEKRNETGSHILDADNVVNRFIREMKSVLPDVGVITDVALDPFTDHGHDGILRDGKIINDETVNVLMKAAVAQADCGTDVIAPSDMMDGRIGAIRRALDDAGHQDVSIMSYTAKFASAFYGPYREAINTAGLLKGDKKTYYVDPANRHDAIREAERDVAEGADMLMVKPGLPYLDVCRDLKDRFQMPTFAYQVSGEFAMIQAAAQNGWIDGGRIIQETMMCFKRAGCDGILTYFAPEIAKALTVQ
ncbi:MAG: porphobilinogen synthase [Pseudomonadota bacterium]